MFTAKDVMALREMSGAGMMDCKRALVETDGDMDKAMEYLREKSLAATAKKGLLCFINVNCAKRMRQSFVARVGLG